MTLADVRSCWNKLNECNPSNYDAHKQGYISLFKEPTNEFRKPTHEEHHQISQIVKSHLAKKAKKTVPLEKTPKQVNLTEFTNPHLDMCDFSSKNASNSDSDK